MFGTARVTRRAPSCSPRALFGSSSATGSSFDPVGPTSSPRSDFARQDASTFGTCHRGLFVKAQDLFDEMYASLADRSSTKLINRLRRVDLLVIDEMGYLNLRPEQSNIFFKLMEERYGRKSTIISTNLDYDEWYAFLGDKQMVGALLDRLRHRCTTVRIDGPSLRTPE